MLPDAERKLLRILNNFSTIRGRMPTFTEIQTKTGSNKADIIARLNNLETNSFIQWDKSDVKSILIFIAWEKTEETKRHWHDN